MSKKKLRKKKDKLLKKLKQQEEEFDRERDAMGDGNFVPFADKVFDDALLAQRDFFDELSPEEQQVAIKILSEYKDEIVGGKTNALDHLWEIDYKWRPVDIEVFLNDEYYAGLITEDLYSTWRQHLLDVCAPDCNVYEIILSGAIGTGKCVKYDTLINTNGGFFEIQDLVDLQYGGCVQTEHDSNKISSFHDEGITETRKVITKHGHVLEGRPNHGVRVLDGLSIAWKQLDDLEEGDCLIEAPAQKFGEVEFPAQIAELFGWIVAEGTSNSPLNQVGIRLSLHETEIDYVYSLALYAKEYFNLSTVSRSYESRCVSLWGNIERYIEVPTSHYKEVPRTILMSTRENICAFLRGLFSGDGWATKNNIAFCTVSEKLARQSQIILTSLGYQCSVTSKKCGYTKDGVRTDTGIAYTVPIIGAESKRKFIDEIGFWHDYKQKNALKQTQDSNNSDHSFSFKLTPLQYEQFRHIQPLYNGNSPKTPNDINKTSSPRGLIRRLKTQNCTTTLLRQIKNAHGALPNVFQKFVDGEYLFDTVKTVEKSKAHCFDLSVKNDPSYISGGFISHNTSFACLHMMYDIYKKSCLRTPQKFYGLMPGAAMVFGIYSVTRELVRDVGYTRLRSYIESSPYFSDKFPYKERIQRKIEFYDSPIEVMAGCVAEGTKIATPQGDVPIEKLVDTSTPVLTSDGSKVFPSKYRGVKYSGVKKCLNIATESGDKVVCSYDHKFTVEDSDGCLIQKKAEELKEWETVFVLRKNEVRKTRIKSITDVGYRKTYDVVEVPETHNVFTNNILTSNSKAFHALGKDLHSFLMDEVNFMQTAKLKHGVRLADVSQAYKIYNAAQTRAKSRYMDEGGMVYLISSRTTRTSFLEQHVKEVKEEVKKKHVVIFDYALWDVNKDRVKYKKPKFRVEIGDAIHPSRIIPDDVEPRVGAETIEVPGEFELQFKRDIDQSLRDIAGIATYALMPFFRDRRTLYACIDKNREHPFTREAVTLNILDDLTLNEFFKVEHLFKVSESMYMPKVRPYARRFAHIDIGLTQDAAGIAIGHVAGMKEVKRMRQDGTFYWDRVPEIYIDLMIRVNAPASGEIDIAKLRAFIISLTDMGLPIASVTADGYQSRDMIQIFKKLGYPNAGILSVDRTVEPYMHLKQAIVENRLSYYHYKPVLLELSDLEHDTEIDKIDHPHTNSEGGHGCFSGDTKISLLDGREAALKELADNWDGKPVYVYTYDGEKITVGKARSPRLTRKKAETVIVVLNNDEEVCCTPDHKWMLRDGTYKRADKLEAGDPLMALYRTDAILHAYTYTHKVISVRKGKKQDVYDLTVDKTHNFVLAAGVFVHNSKDVSDCLAGVCHSIMLDETVHKASTVTTFLDDEPEDKIKKDLLPGEVVVKGTMIVDVEKLEKELRRRLLP